MATKLSVRRHHFAVLAPILVLVSACAAPDDWARPSTDAAATARDYHGCEALAMRADLSAAGAGPLDESLGTSVDSLPRTSERDEYLGDTDLSEAQLKAMLGRCMAARGYARARQ